MNAVSRVLEWSPESELSHVVEPLADLICASEKPEVAMRLILSVLRRQVNITNGLAAAQCARSIGQAV
jgi:hypothetical protein